MFSEGEGITEENGVVVFSDLFFLHDASFCTWCNLVDTPFTLLPLEKREKRRRGCQTGELADND